MMMKRKANALLAVVLSISAAGTTACSGRSPSDTVKGFYRAVEQGDFEKAITYLSPGLLSMMGEQKLKVGLASAQTEMIEKGGVQELEIVDEKIAGQVATLTVKLRYGNGTEEVEAVKLIETDRGWKIHFEK